MYEKVPIFMDAPVTIRYIEFKLGPRFVKAYFLILHLTRDIPRTLGIVRGDSRQGGLHMTL